MIMPVRQCLGWCPCHCCNFFGARRLYTFRFALCNCTLLCTCALLVPCLSLSDCIVVKHTGGGLALGAASCGSLESASGWLLQVTPLLQRQALLVCTLFACSPRTHLTSNTTARRCSPCKRRGRTSTSYTFIQQAVLEAAASMHAQELRPMPRGTVRHHLHP